MTITKKIIKGYVKIGHTVLDCTVGNGKDTLLLASSVGKSGKVYGFDIQASAIKNTKSLLKKNNIDIDSRIVLIQDGHEHIDKYLKEEVDFVIYNLGYLPGGNKAIITKAETTLLSLEKSLRLLKPRGILLITVYIGHEGGIHEHLAVEEYLAELDQREYSVLKNEFINQKNNPPLLYIIEKSGCEEA